MPRHKRKINHADFDEHHLVVSMVHRGDRKEYPIDLVMQSSKSKALHIEQLDRRPSKRQALTWAKRYARIKHLTVAIKLPEGE